MGITTDNNEIRPCNYSLRCRRFGRFRSRHYHGLCSLRRRLDCLLLPDNKAVLADILTYHVADGKVMSTDLTDKQVITTLQKGTVAISIDVSIDGETVKVNDATVIVADIEADNGVIHAIDGVLVPPEVDVAAFLASDACAEPGDGDSGAALLSVSAAMVGVGLVTAFL